MDHHLQFWLQFFCQPWWPPQSFKLSHRIGIRFEIVITVINNCLCFFGVCTCLSFSFAVLTFFLCKSYLDFQFHPLLDLFSFLVHGNGKQPQPVINISYLPDFVFFVFHLSENLLPFLRLEKQLQQVSNISYPFQIFYLSNSLHFKSSEHQCYNVLIKILQISTRGARLFRYKKILVLPPVYRKFPAERFCESN